MLGLYESILDNDVIGKIDKTADKVIERTHTSYLRFPARAEWNPAKKEVTSDQTFTIFIHDGVPSIYVYYRSTSSPSAIIPLKGAVMDGVTYNCNLSIAYDRGDVFGGLKLSDVPFVHGDKLIISTVYSHYFSTRSIDKLIDCKPNFKCLELGFCTTAAVTVIGTLQLDCIKNFEIVYPDCKPYMIQPLLDATGIKAKSIYIDNDSVFFQAYDIQSKHSLKDIIATYANAREYMADENQSDIRKLLDDMIKFFKNNRGVTFIVDELHHTMHSTEISLGSDGYLKYRDTKEYDYVNY